MRTMRPRGQDGCTIMMNGSPMPAVPSTSRGRVTPARLDLDLVALLAAAGLTQKAAAERLEVGRGTIASWCDRGVPDEGNKVKRLAVLLQKEESDLRMLAAGGERLGARVIPMPGMDPGGRGQDSGSGTWPSSKLVQDFHEGLVKQLNSDAGLSVEVIEALRPTAVALGVWKADAD